MKKGLSNIELFLFDLDGTVYIDDKEIKGAFDTINTLMAMGKKVCFFTNNSSRSAEDYVLKLNKMGLKTSLDSICTSGQVTCEYINKNFKGKSVFVLGNEKLKAEFKKHNITLNEKTPDLLVLGFDTSLCYDRLYQFCIELTKGKYYIATHPDMVCPAEFCPMPDIGAMMLMIEATTGRKPDVIVGKPYTISGDAVKERYNISAEKVAMIGDRLYTDIQFGINNGFKTVLVLSGETTAEMANENDIKADYVFNSVNDILKHI